MVDDRWAVSALQPQPRGVVTTFEPHARALTVRIFGAITAVLFGRCAAVVVRLSPAVMLLQLLSEASMVVLRREDVEQRVGWHSNPYRKRREGVPEK